MRAITRCVVGLSLHPVLASCSGKASMACRTHQEQRGRRLSQGSYRGSHQYKTKQRSEWAHEQGSWPQHRAQAWGLEQAAWVAALGLCIWPHERGWVPGKDMPFRCHKKIQGKTQIQHAHLLGPAHYFVMCRRVFPPSLGTLSGQEPCLMCILQTKHSA